MFSLVKFDDKKLFIIRSGNVRRLVNKKCIVKYKGGQYEAFLVSKNDDKSELLAKKIKMELRSSSKCNNTRNSSSNTLCDTDSSAASNLGPCITTKGIKSKLNTIAEKTKPNENETNQANSYEIDITAEKILPNDNEPILIESNQASSYEKILPNDNESILIESNQANSYEIDIIAEKILPNDNEPILIKSNQASSYEIDIIAEKILPNDNESIRIKSNQASSYEIDIIAEKILPNDNESILIKSNQASSYEIDIIAEKILPNDNESVYIKSNQASSYEKILPNDNESILIESNQANSYEIDIIAEKILPNDNESILIKSNQASSYKIDSIAEKILPNDNEPILMKSNQASSYKIDIIAEKILPNDNESILIKSNQASSYEIDIIAEKILPNDNESILIKYNQASSYKIDSIAEKILPNDNEPILIKSNQASSYEIDIIAEKILPNDNESILIKSNEVSSYKLATTFDETKICKQQLKEFNTIYRSDTNFKSDFTSSRSINTKTTKFINDTTDYLNSTTIYNLQSKSFIEIETIADVRHIINNRIVPYSDSDSSSICDTNSPIKLPTVHSLNISPITSTISNTNKNTSDGTYLQAEISLNENLYSENETENTMNSRSFNDVSSTHDKSLNSEYIPDHTSSSCKEISVNAEDTEHQDAFINLIDEPVNVNSIIVPHSQDKLKKHFCIFCKKLQSAIGRHLIMTHKEEKEVKKALVLPKRCKERLKIIASLRKQGDFEHNTSANHNTGVLIVSRRQQNKCKNNADDYICCKNCKGFFSKRTIRIHVTSCDKSDGKRNNLIEGRRLTQYMHAVANNALKTKIFPILRNDDTVRAIRYDELAIKFGNKLAEKYASVHQHDMIRANLRLLGRFMIEIKNLDSDIKELKDVYYPHHFDKCVIALRKVSKWNEENMGFDYPSTAQSLTSLIKKCGKKQRTELIKEHRHDLKSELDDFLLLWDEDIPTVINKKAFEDQINKKRVKKIKLPSKEDIKKLYNHLKTKIFHAMKRLYRKFRLSSWTNLVEATLVLVQIFNRRRAGEIERLTTENFSNKEIITDNMDTDALKNFSEASIRLAKQFVRVSLRGKLGRTVSILLCPMSVKAIELIVKFRSSAGINTDNIYIFSKASSSELSKPYYRACPLLKKFSEQCGAQIPESLRGTMLRKHIATYTSMLNIEEASIDRLANFMGHHKDVHKSVYRMPVPVAEFTCISKLLLDAVGNEVDDEHQQENVDINPQRKDLENEDIIKDAADEEETHSLDNSMLEGSKNSSTSLSRKRRSTSPFGKTKRSRWNTAEKKTIYAIFGDLHKLEKLPSLKKCSEAIRQSPTLNKRTPQQIKSWIDNQRRYTKNKNEKDVVM